MRVVLVALVVLLAAGVSASPLTESEYQFLFSRWMVQYEKSYNHDEFFYRFGIWRTAYEMIESHNAGNHSFTLAMNKFGDLTRSEFRAKYTGYVPNHRARNLGPAPHRHPHIQPAASLDWRSKNAVTPVKDQGNCGACWAFSTTGSVEGAWAIAKGQLISLSEQELVDCSTAQGNNGCSGGLMDYAFTWIIANKGIGTEESYPYTATGPNTCQTVPSVVTISNYHDVTPLNENELLSAATIGPVSIAIEADQAVFQYYSGGVLDSAACGTTLDHGVLIAGYGTDSGKDYWLVKNSWGAAWGEKGYVRLARNKNTCGLSQDPSYPIV